MIFLLKVLYMKKFKNRKVEVDGHLFDSTMESDYYLYLKEIFYLFLLIIHVTLLTFDS